MQSKRTAVTALGLGLVGLFTVGGLGIGSLVGLVLAAVALVRGSREGRDVAWAAVAANVFALATIVPVGTGVLIHGATPTLPADDGALPAPAQDPFEALAPSVPPPPPPPARAEVDRASTTPIRVGAGIEEPRKRHHVNPAYPPQALASRVQGVVILECTIGATGEVVDVKTLRGEPLLAEAAVAAVRQWQYEPTRLNGVAVPVIMTVTVNFKLS